MLQRKILAKTLQSTVLHTDGTTTTLASFSDAIRESRKENFGTSSATMAK